MLLASFFLMAAQTITPEYCLIAGPDEDNQIIVPANRNFSKRIEKRGLSVSSCPENFVWHADVARNICNIYTGYGREAKQSFQDLYGLKPRLACKAGLAAAGVKFKEYAEE